MGGLCDGASAHPSAAAWVVQLVVRNRTGQHRVGSDRASGGGGGALGGVRTVLDLEWPRPKTLRQLAKFGVWPGGDDLCEEFERRDGSPAKRMRRRE